MPPKKHSAVVAQRDLFANSAVNGDNDDEEEEEEEEEEPSGQFLDDEYIAGGEHDSHIKGGVGTGTGRAVHQCAVCNKIFVSFKGLQQHAVIHTDQKPFVCDICSKAFRFKSNLFEHRSVHSGFTPHQCPFCGKTCRLKGNLKKHLKTHVNTPEELQDAWRPFASNRRPPMDIPDDAVVVRSTGEPVYTPPSRPRRRKLGLGDTVQPWIERIERGDILPSMRLQDKLTRLQDLLLSAEQTFVSVDECFDVMRAIPLERFDCPICKQMFVSRLEAAEHMTLEHPPRQDPRPLFCEVCLANFPDKKTLEQHQLYHTKVNELLNKSELKCIHEPQALSVDECIELVLARERDEAAIKGPNGPPILDQFTTDKARPIPPPTLEMQTSHNDF